MTTTRQLLQLFLNSTGVTTDTRQVKEGQLFVALKGDNHDGNQYAAQALEKGAAYAVVDDPNTIASDRYLLVDNGLVALQELAKAFLAHLKQTTGLRVLAICGSNGKTTTKELTARVLGTTFQTFATPGNLNNHIGVPLSILRLTEADQLAVLELGANAPGEIALLSTIADPDAALITNVGKDHLEGFGTVEGVAKANGEVFDYVMAKGGAIFINETEPYLCDLVPGYHNVVTYPKGNGLSFQVLHKGPELNLSVSYDGATHELQTNMVGSYNLANVATALTIGLHYQVPLDAALAAIASYTPANMRSQLVKREANQVLLDAYNANPSSMELALRSLNEMQTDLSKGFFIGDMAELGPDSEQEHKAMGELAATLTNISLIAFVGPKMAVAASACPGSLHFQDKAAAIFWLQTQKLNKHLILLKGSRSSAMEQLLEAL